MSLYLQRPPIRGLPCRADGLRREKPPPTGPIKESALDGGDHPKLKATLASGRAFVCPAWHKQAWHVGVHKTHLALAEIEKVLCERLFPYGDLARADPNQSNNAPWLRVYSGGNEPVDHPKGPMYLKGAPSRRGVKGDQPWRSRRRTT